MEAISVIYNPRESELSTTINDIILKMVRPINIETKKKRNLSTSVVYHTCSYYYVIIICS